jgi:hypothetical protein
MLFETASTTPFLGQSRHIDLEALGKLDMWAHSHIACMSCNSIAYVYRSKVNVSALLVGL